MACEFRTLLPMSAKPVRVVYSLVMFVVVSVVAGVLVAGLFVPAAGIAGLGSRAAAGEMKSIPAELEVGKQPEQIGRAHV